MMKYRMNQKLIVPENWTNKDLIVKGWVVGIEKIQDRQALSLSHQRHAHGRCTGVHQLRAVQGRAAHTEKGRTDPGQ